MKSIVTILVAVFAVSASAESELACWNSYAKKGSRPIVKAQIIDNVTIENVTFNFQEGEKDKNGYPASPWSSYFQEAESAQVEFGQPSPEDIVGEEILSNRSPYKGNNEFQLYMGSVKWKSEKNKESIVFRWILPPDLSNESLKDFRFANRPNERVNSVIISPAAPAQGQYGDDYVKLFCVSK